ncbi:MAG: hypothetical protein QOG42_416, partial [Solirubrobacteraceae bacterium]|nr:hypothetical protein [Solirubrobacteraceae bacterium]
MTGQSFIHAMNERHVSSHGPAECRSFMRRPGARSQTALAPVVAARHRCMQRINLTSPAFEYDDADPAAMRAGLHRIGREFGAAQTGTSFYELAPGVALCPYHYEYGEEEWLLVVAGTPTLRDPDGSHELAVNDVVFFPRGPAGAHQIRNDGRE